MKNKNLIVWLLIGLIVWAGAMYFGTSYTLGLEGINFTTQSVWVQDFNEDNFDRSQAMLLGENTVEQDGNIKTETQVFINLDFWEDWKIMSIGAKEVSCTQTCKGGCTPLGCGVDGYWWCKASLCARNDLGDVCDAWCEKTETSGIQVLKDYKEQQIDKRSF